jgi:hypothetical protein
VLSELMSSISDVPEKIDEIVLSAKNADRLRRNSPVADLTLSSSHALLKNCGKALNHLLLLVLLAVLLLFFVEFLSFSIDPADLRTLRAGLSLGLEEEWCKVRMVLICKNKR